MFLEVGKEYRVFGIRTAPPIMEKKGVVPPGKVVLFLVCLLFYAGLSGGYIDPGEPLTMWAFLCASGGMMLGILFPLRSDPPVDVDAK